MKKLFLLIFGSVTLSQPFPFVSNVSHKTADMGWKPLGTLEGIRVNNRKQGVVSIETAVRTHTRIHIVRLEARKIQIMVAGIYEYN